MEATVSSCHLFGYCPTYPKFCEITYCQYLWKAFSDFVDFLHVVIRILLDILWSYKNMLFWVDSVSHTLLSNGIVRCFKLKKLENYIRLQIHFLLPLKLRKHNAVLGYGPKKSLDQSVCRISYFWIVNLSTEGPLLHSTCFKITPAESLHQKCTLKLL